MANPADSVIQNLLPVQAYFAVDGTFQTFIGQGLPFYATINPNQSGLNITSSTINSTTIGATTPSTGIFTNIGTTTGTIATTPSGNTDIANKFYVDTVAQGLGPKAACAVGTTVNITLSGLQTIDTYTTVAGDRVLVKNQTTSANNGIYIASASAWTRSTDMDVWAEVPGAYTVILNGGQSNTGWVCTATVSGTIGVTAMPWVQFSAINTYFAGTGLNLASNTFSIANTGVTAASVGSASKTLTATVNAQGQLTALADTNIAIAASQITSGTIDTARISGSYTGITGVGTLTAGTWNASTIGVAYGGTGATTLIGYVKGGGTTPFTASTTIPNTDISGLGTMSTQNANSVAITGGSATLGTLITSGLTGYLYGNASSAVTASTTIPTSALSGNFVSTFSAGTTGFTPSSNTTGAVTLSGTLNVANGGTGVTASTGANSVVLRDASVNISANAVSEGFSNVAAAGTTTVLTVASVPNYVVTGSGGQTYQLPDATTLANGANYTFNNNQSSGTIVVKNNSSTTVATIQSGGYVDVILLSNSIAAGSWDVHNFAPSNVSWSTNTFDYAGSFTSGTWNGNTVAYNRGGTGQSSLFVAGGIVYGSTTTALAVTAVGTTGQVLTSNGSSAPTWATPTAYATVTDDTTTNAVRYPLYAAATSGNLATEYVASTKYQFNPSTGVLTATGFSGSGAALTSIPNSALTNSSVTIGSTAVALGATVTTFAGLTSVTSTTFVGALTGNASTATSATTATNATNTAITDDTTTATSVYPTWVTTTTGNLPQKTASTKLSFVPSTGVLSATSFTGAGTGLTGTAASLSIGGNAANVTGTVAVANGGTGLTTTPANGALDIGNGTGFTRTTLTAGTGVTITNASGSITIASSVTPVTSVTGTSPVVSSGGTTPAISLATAYGDTLNPYASKTANYVLAAPNGTAGVPTFRAIVAADIPTLNQNTTGNAATATSATTATNIAGGANLQIPYNTGSGATSFVAAPTIASTYLQYNGTGFAWASASGLGTVTSVGQSFTGGLISVSGSPITTAGTLALTVAGTSGGIVYFSSASTWASSGALTQYGVVYGGGAGASPVATAAGTTGQVLIATTSAAPSWGQVSLTAGVTGTLPIANGGTGLTTTPANGALDIGNGTGFTRTTLTGTASQVAVTNASGSITLSLPSTINVNTSGSAASLSATLAIASGGTGQTTASAAFNALSPITSTGDLIIGNGVNSATRLAIGTNGYVLTSNGTTASWAATSSSSPSVTTKTTTYTITTTDGTILCDATSAAFTVTLPTAVSATGKTYIVKKTDSSANAVTIATTSSQTIDTISTQTLGIQSAWLVIQSDGSNWQIVG